jgi:hypothetical protein
MDGGHQARRPVSLSPSNRSLGAHPAGAENTAGRPADVKGRIREALIHLLEFYKSNHVDEYFHKLKGTVYLESPTDPPGERTIPLGAFDGPFGPGLKELAHSLRQLVWKDAESLLEYLSLLHELADVDTSRIATLYAAQPGIQGIPRGLAGADMAFARRLLGDLPVQRDPWLRILMMRGLAAGNLSYEPAELGQFVDYLGSESVPACVTIALGVLSPSVSSVTKVRDFLVAQALEKGMNSAAKNRQNTAAQVLFNEPRLREDPTVAAAAAGLLRQIHEPALQFAALNFLNRVAGFPDLTERNPLAVQYFDALLDAYRTLPADRPATAESGSIRRIVIEKVATFDMPKAVQFTESILRNPALPDSEKLAGLRSLGWGSRKTYSSSFDEWLAMLGNVAADTRIGGEVRALAYSHFVLFPLEKSGWDATRAEQHADAVLERMKVDPDQAVREQAQVLIDYCREFGLRKN